MIKNNWLTFAKQIKSPHFNQRPSPDDISLLVIHNISLPPRQFGGDFVEDFFYGQLDCSVDPYFKTIQSLKVSSHLYIKRDGQIIQFVAFDQRAWHAGVSKYINSNDVCRHNCNDFSIGIELEGTDDIAYTDIQYTQLVKVSRLLLAHYPGLNKSTITGHCHIAPDRKTDPGESFDWSRYLAKL